MLYVVVLNRGYVDEVYQAVIVRPVLGIAKWLSESVDVEIIDRAFEGFSAGLEGLGKWLSVCIEEGVIDRAFDGFGAAVAGMGERMRQMQSGQFHHYAIAMLLGAVLLLGFYLVAG